MKLTRFLVEMEHGDEAEDRIANFEDLITSLDGVRIIKRCAEGYEWLEEELPDAASYPYDYYITQPRIRGNPQGALSWAVAAKVYLKTFSIAGFQWTYLGKLPLPPQEEAENVKA
jgi:hypothetical protein